MQRLILIALVAIALSAAACRPLSSVVVPAPPTPTPEIFMAVPDEVRAEGAAREALAQHLGLDLAAVAVRQTIATDWPDSCLALPLRDQACQIGSFPGFRIVLDVAAATYEVRTDLRAETVLIAGRVDPGLGGLPAVCQGIGQATFYAPEHDFCFAYPARYTLGETSPTRGQIYGPLADDTPEATRAMLRFQLDPLAAGDTLDAQVDAYLAQLGAQALPEITRSATRLGGESAEQLESVLGGQRAWDVFMLHEQTLYHFMFTPAASDAPQASGEVEDLFMTVTSSFTFLPAAP
jgi:hypothetical protein